MSKIAEIKFTYPRPGVLCIDGYCQPEPLTNPTRLLPQHSVSPFCEENRRRRVQFDKFQGLKGEIRALLNRYEEYLIIPVGEGRCAELWENQQSDEVWDAFSDMKETVYEALEVFTASVRQPSRLLWQYHGCNAKQFQAELKEEERLRYLAKLGLAFILDFDRKFSPEVGEDDDLPF